MNTKCNNIVSVCDDKGRYHAIRWDGTAATADVIRQHGIYCDLGPLDTCVVCDNKMPCAAWLKNGYWVVLGIDSIVAYNLPDEVFRERFHVLALE